MADLPASPIEANGPMAEATPPSTTTRPVMASSLNPAHAIDNTLFSSQPENSRRNEHVSISNSNIGEVVEIPDNLNTTTVERVRVIWGTNIVISDALSSFRSFLQNYTRAHRRVYENRFGRASEETLSADFEPCYLNLLRQIRDTEAYHLQLDCEDLKAFPETNLLSKQLLHYPNEMISLMDMVINDLFAEMFPDVDIHNDPIQVRPFNIGSISNLRELNPSDIDKLISVKGLVIRVSNILPDMRVAYFSCQNCGHSVVVENNRGHIPEPRRCPRDECGATHSMSIVHNRCVFSDKQIVKIQETPDSIPDGQTPHSVTLCTYDALIDAARPGDRVEVTGIFRSSPVRVNNNQRKVKSIFRTYIDVVHIRTSTQQTAQQEDSFGALEAVKQRYTTESWYSKLASSLAPSVWGLDDIKKGLLLQLFGGVSKALQKTGTNKFRGDINVLLAGDPGVSKSQLLQYVHKLSPRGVYTSGKGSSAVGLTAYITRDADTNQLVLESGALVLSDGGICCIDEFDKMSDETRTILHEVMEQQTISVAKAGIITSLNARTSILASANPVESKYNVHKSIIENLALPPTILSRFDLIYLLLDNISVENDQRLGRHIVSLYTSKNVPLSNDSIVLQHPMHPSNLINFYIQEPKLLSACIQRGRSLKPVISEEAARDICSNYVSMRKANGTMGKTISATTRQLESLVRLSEAHARMRLSVTVDKEDVCEAFRLIKDALLTYAVDPLTGKIDMDMINTGKSSALREQQGLLKRTIMDILSTRGHESTDLGTLVALINSASSYGVSEKWIQDCLEDLANEDVIRVSGNVRRGNAQISRVF